MTKTLSNTALQNPEALNWTLSLASTIRLRGSYHLLLGLRNTRLPTDGPVFIVGRTSDKLYVKMAVFWDAGSCSPVETDRRFRLAYCLYYQAQQSRLVTFILAAMRTWNITHIRSSHTHDRSVVTQMGKSSRLPSVYIDITCWMTTQSGMQFALQIILRQLLIGSKCNVSHTICHSSIKQLSA
jgi:hypothetical protein